MKQVKVEVTLIYDLEIDENSGIVKEYINEEDLINDLASYRFTTLPVINNGVNILDIELVDWQYADDE